MATSHEGFMAMPTCMPSAEDVAADLSIGSERSAVFSSSNHSSARDNSSSIIVVGGDGALSAEDQQALRALMAQSAAGANHDSTCVSAKGVESVAPTCTLSAIVSSATDVTADDRTYSSASEDEGGAKMNTALAASGVGQRSELPTPVFFRDNILVDRDVGVAVINIVGFHQYAQATHGADVTRDHAALVAYIHEVARRCGGVLDTFAGDKFWVSFNATSKCAQWAVAATCFAWEVVTTVNKEAVAAQTAHADAYRRRRNNSPCADLPPARFYAALRGVTAGVACGRAFVGPLGTDNVRRHTIISNAVSEASALERMGLRYPGSGLMVGGDMIPAIEGYFQYLLLDATALPGSGGLRRRIACVKAPMCAPGREASLVRPVAGRLGIPLPRHSPYAPMNSCFNAFLEGRTAECSQLLEAIDRVVAHDLLTAAGMDPITKRPVAEVAAERRRAGGEALQLTPEERAEAAQLSKDREVLGLTAPLAKLEAVDTSVMLQFVWSLAHSGEEGGVGPAVDGRLYRCKLGDVHLPAEKAYDDELF